MDNMIPLVDERVNQYEITVRKMDSGNYVIRNLFLNTSYFMTKSDLIALKERIEYTIHLIDIDSGVIPWCQFIQLGRVMCNAGVVGAGYTKKAISSTIHIFFA